jgi:hypothetical protein
MLLAIPAAHFIIATKPPQSRCLRPIVINMMMWTLPVVKPGTVNTNSIFFRNDLPLFLAYHAGQVQTHHAVHDDVVKQLYQAKNAASMRGYAYVTYAHTDDIGTSIGNAVINTVQVPLSTITA